MSCANDDDDDDEDLEKKEQKWLHRDCNYFLSSLSVCMSAFIIHMHINYPRTQEES